MANRWIEIIEDDNRRLSSTRTCMVLGIIIGSMVVMCMTYLETLTEGIFAIYMLATGGVYGLGKWGDTKTRMEEIKAESTPATIKVENADRVSTESGNVNVMDNKK